ncbi:hypothetical protein AB0912_10110 [Streptomyces sp. NPDC007084]|uniref:hypothetical protein n=1 Tax=Streptomyces sp. NPDC007084 TaxID=3154313 RepID=UPI003452ADA2
MNGGIPPLRDRYLAAGFIVVMYLLIGALLAGLLGAGFAGSGVWAVAAAVVGGALGAVCGVWRVRRTPEDERADEHADDRAP